MKPRKTVVALVVAGFVLLLMAHAQAMQLEVSQGHSAESLGENLWRHNHAVTLSDTSYDISNLSGTMSYGSWTSSAATDPGPSYSLSASRLVSKAICQEEGNILIDLYHSCSGIPYCTWDAPQIHECTDEEEW